MMYSSVWLIKSVWNAFGMPIRRFFFSVKFMCRNSLQFNSRDASIGAHRSKCIRVNFVMQIHYVSSQKCTLRLRSLHDALLYSRFISLLNDINFYGSDSIFFRSVLKSVGFFMIRSLTYIAADSPTLCMLRRLHSLFVTARNVVVIYLFFFA